MKDNHHVSYGGHHRYFVNRECEYFPCHAGIPEADFSCLFCYCPLYALGRDCGGGFVILENGTKDCSNCAFPHFRKNYDAVCRKAASLCERMKEYD